MFYFGAAPLILPAFITTTAWQPLGDSGGTGSTATGSGDPSRKFFHWAVIILSVPEEENRMSCVQAAGFY